MEQNALDLIFGLFNMGEQDAWREHQLHQQQHNAESTSSSLEILRTLNISFAAGDYHAAPAAALCDSAQDFNADATKDHQSLRLKHTESFLQKERIFIAQLIAKATEICPTIFGEQGTVNYLYVSSFLTSSLSSQMAASRARWTSTLILCVDCACSGPTWASYWTTYCSGG